MMRYFLRRLRVVTSFATLFFMLSSSLRADLTTARIALQTRKFELALAQAEDLAVTHPFDNAMIVVRAHVELGQFKKAQTSAARAGLGPKIGGPPHPKSPRTARPGQTAAGHVSPAPRVDLSTDQNERITATRLLRQIQAGLTVKISGSLDIAPSSNINKISYLTTHTSINPLTGALQTIPWTANEPERSEYGLLLWCGLSYALPKTKLGTQLASLNLSTDIYNEPRFNRISLSINHGLVLTPAAQH